MQRGSDYLDLSSSLNNLSVNNCHDSSTTKDIIGAGYHGSILIDSKNSRLKSLAFNGDNVVGYVDQIMNVAIQNDLGKIIIYATENLRDPLITLGFIYEGTIPSFFMDDDCHFLSYFIDHNRKASPYLEKEEQILSSINNSTNSSESTDNKSNFVIRTVKKEEADLLVELYRQVFTSYPSALLDVNYVKSVINDTVLFMAAFDECKIVSAASAEIDKQHYNAEMTDCATLDAYRGRGLVTLLIKELEKEMWYQNMRVVYSLARAGSYGMNAVLHKLSYKYTGRLINNCHINSRYEDMNIWVKTNKML